MLLGQTAVGCFWVFLVMSRKMISTVKPYVGDAPVGHRDTKKQQPRWKLPRFATWQYNSPGFFFKVSTYIKVYIRIYIYNIYVYTYIIYYIYTHIKHDPELVVKGESTVKPLIVGMIFEQKKKVGTLGVPIAVPAWFGGAKTWILILTWLNFGCFGSTPHFRTAPYMYIYSIHYIITLCSFIITICIINPSRSKETNFAIQLFQSMDWFKGKFTGKPHI